jgi:hypothetical protein
MAGRPDAAPRTVLEMLIRQRDTVTYHDLAGEFALQAEGLGIRAGITPRHLARVAAGHTGAGAVTRRVLEAMFKVPASILLASPTDIEPRAAFERQPQFAQDEESLMRRRTMIRTLTGVAAGAGTTLAGLEALRQGIGVAAGADRTVEEWQEIAADYARDIFAESSAQVVAEVAADLTVLQQIMDVETRPVARQELEAVGAQLCVYMSRSLSSLGQHRSARRWWSTAHELAETSSNMTIRQWVHGWDAITGLYDGRPHTQVGARIQEGLALSQSATVGRAQMLSTQAQMLSLQQRPEEARAALRELETLTDQLSTAIQTDDITMHGWPAYRLHHTESYVYTRLGDRTSASSAQQAALDIYPPEVVREAVQLQMHQAACAVSEGDISDGVRFAHDLLDGLPNEHHNAYLYYVARWVVDAVPVSERASSGADELAERTGPAALKRLEA